MFGPTRRKQGDMPEMTQVPVENQKISLYVPVLYSTLQSRFAQPADDDAEVRPNDHRFPVCRRADGRQPTSAPLTTNRALSPIPPRRTPIWAFSSPAMEEGFSQVMPKPLAAVQVQHGRPRTKSASMVRKPPSFADMARRVQSGALSAAAAEFVPGGGGAGGVRWRRGVVWGFIVFRASRRARCCPLFADSGPLRPGSARARARAGPKRDYARNRRSAGAQQHRKPRVRPSAGD